MNSSAGFILFIIVISSLAFIGFCIYFIFKQLEFVVRAINMYKSMITRLDMIIKLLNDQNKLQTSKCGVTLLPAPNQCPNCKKEYSEGKYCEDCGTKLN